MPNFYLATPKLIMLITLNVVVWALPPLINRRHIFGPYVFIPFLFSSSYWFPIVFLFLDPSGHIPPNIEVGYIDYAAQASLLAGLGYGAVYFLFCSKYNGLKPKDVTRVTFMSAQELGKSIQHSVRIVVPLLYVAADVILLYSFRLSLDWIGVGDRVYFYSLHPFWYSKLLPLAGLLIGIANLLFFMGYSGHGKRILVILMFVSTYFLVIMNGFDGGRRYAAIALFFTLAGYVFQTRELPSAEKRYKKRVFWFLFFSVIVTISLLGTARKGIVGWHVSISGNDVYDILRSIISPTPTLHVNTQMARYVSLFGVQGYSNYLRAIGNTLLPQFILRRYVFGIPLVLEVRDRFHWYGQDFGILAEAIYSGGLFGAFLIHAVLGIIANKLYLDWINGSEISGIFYLSFVIAVMNSIRSDAMNFLKVWIYFGLMMVGLYFLLFLREKRGE